LKFITEELHQRLDYWQNMSSSQDAKSGRRNINPYEDDFQTKKLLSQYLIMMKYINTFSLTDAPHDIKI
jgi:hypothetical protein